MAFNLLQNNSFEDADVIITSKRLFQDVGSI